MNSETREQQLRHEVADWVQSHLTGDFACLKYRGGSGDEEAWPELRKAWEQELARAAGPGSAGRRTPAGAASRLPNR